MSCYGPLAQWYDSLTADVPYESFLALYKSIFKQDGGEFNLLLDLCCGTGTLTSLLAESGYDMIGVDASEDMLMEARDSAYSKGLSILYLCQEAAELDLYGTVDACISSLDSINYISPDDLPQLFHKLKLFIRPGGLFIFDIRSIEWLKSMDGMTSVDEDDDLLCLWRADFDEDSSTMNYGIDIFSRKGELWERESESHTEYAYSCSELSSLLEGNGFGDIRLIKDGPHGELGRIFIVSKRL